MTKLTFLQAAHILEGQSGCPDDCPSTLRDLPGVADVAETLTFCNKTCGGGHRFVYTIFPSAWPAAPWAALHRHPAGATACLLGDALHRHVHVGL